YIILCLTLLQIHELGNLKAKKLDNVPIFCEVTEPAKVLLDAGEEIPCDLMAKVLKFLLLQIKTTDQQRRVAEQLKLGSQIFKDVANLIYDCLDWRRQHQHYLESMKLIDVAAAVGPHTQPLEVLPTSLPMTPLSKKKSVQEESPPVDLHPVTTHVDMRYYSSLLDLVPPEASSVPLILHCMLEQVCFQGFDPEEVELSMMRLSPVWDLIQSVKQQRNSSSCWMAVKQQLQHYCTDDDVSWPVVERLFHQSVFEAMPLTRLDKDGGLLKTAGPLGTLEPAEQHPPTIIPWDNPLSYAKQQLHNLQTKGKQQLSNRSLAESPEGTVAVSIRILK
uniref:Uncharacterized protein n=1 Tax=Mastacembelus armatus TaxID=205130 RepID=A0A7N8Y618_9TELE